jgi:hypothetical protein
MNAVDRGLVPGQVKPDYYTGICIIANLAAKRSNKRYNSKLPVGRFWHVPNFPIQIACILIFVMLAP